MTMKLNFNFYDKVTCLLSDLDFKHSSPPNIMSSPSYSQSLHGKK